MTARLERARDELINILGQHIPVLQALAARTDVTLEKQALLHLVRAYERYLGYLHLERQP